jgi:glycerol-3-phosphate dehydrogenase
LPDFVLLPLQKTEAKAQKKFPEAIKSLLQTGLISIIGGKWTTYRKMAEDTVDKAMKVHNLGNTTSKTEHLSIHGNKT